MIREILKKYLLLICFTSFISCFAIFDIITGDKELSELENRYLTTKPQASLQSIVSGKYSKEYEKYINDQFIMRDLFVSFKSVIEYGLMKIENNNIIYGANNHLFEKNTEVNEKRLNENIAALVAFRDKYNVNFDFIMIPSSYTIYSEDIPYGLELVNELKEEEYIYSLLRENNINCIDISKALISEKSRYIYYNTDHHWTTWGAYLGYKEFISTKGITAPGYESYKKNEVNDFLGTYYSKSKYFKAKADTITYIDTDNLKVDIDGTKYSSLYDNDKFTTSDKYSAFLRGNNGITTIISNSIEESRKGTSILIFKDSFANSFIPFLANDYEEITVIDLRHYKGSIEDLIVDKKYTDMLIMYNFVNFSSDINIKRLKF